VSPDGTRRAVATGGVVIIRLDRPGETTRLDRPSGALAWSPDGTQLASLTAGDDGTRHLWVFNADGTGEVRDLARAWPPTPSPGHQWAGHLVWSPDGKRFAFTVISRPDYRQAGPRYDHLYMVLSDGSGLRNLSIEPGGLCTDGGLAWSPDGRRLAFRSGHGIGTLDVDMKWTEIEVPIHGTRSPQQQPGYRTAHDSRGSTAAASWSAIPTEGTGRS
jgi:Tol biopolymer transport system component